MVTKFVGRNNSIFLNVQTIWKTYQSALTEGTKIKRIQISLGPSY